MDEPLIQMSLEKFLNDLGSSAPTPGGGAAAALTGALAAQCGHKAGSLTVGKPKFAEVEADVQDLMQRLARSCTMLNQLVTEDATAYDNLSQAFKLPKDDPNRSNQIAAAATFAAGVPLQVIAITRRVLRALERIRPISNPNLVSDVDVGLHLARAAMQSAALNVEVNLPFVPEPQRATVAETLQQLCNLDDA